MTNNLPVLSIIVPIYKVEKWLPRCLDSILSQRFTDFEAILIDDGSPDRCGEIIDEYAKRDERIIVIHQRNQGVSAARNAGLNIARGEYIGFVDPDDYIAPEMYQTLINQLERTGSDISCCNWNDVSIDAVSRENRMPYIKPIMDHEEFINHVFDMPYTILGVVWNKLYKRELINFSFPVEFTMGEDTWFTIKYACRVRSAVYCEERLYNVFQRADSAMRLKPEKMAEGLTVWEQVMDLVKRENTMTKMLAEKMYLDKCLLFSKESGQAGISASKRLCIYVKKHLIKVMFNYTIYWKTRIQYAKFFVRYTLV